MCVGEPHPSEGLEVDDCDSFIWLGLSVNPHVMASASEKKQVSI